MSNKFLSSLHGESLSVLTTGTASLYLKSLKINDLEDSKNVVTDDKFLTTGNGASELTFINTDDHTSPGVGISKIYFKTDGNLYKKNNLGEESTLAGGNGLVPIPAGTINNITDIDYKSDIEKTTWSDTSLNKYNYYNYYSSPKKPDLRTPYVPLDNRAFNVSNEVDLDLAITDQKDNIFITTDFNITSSKVIAFPCKIYGDSLSKPTITGVGVTTSLFNVSSDNVFFQNLILTNDNTSSNTNCIFFGFNNDAKNNCVHDCVFNTNEFAITSSHYQVQIYNNVFQFIGTPDSHRYIFLNRCVGEVLIYNNVFHSNGIFSTAGLLINSSNGSTDFDGGHLVLYSNSSSSGYIQRMAIMETNPVNFKLSLIENTIETYTDFFILYGDTMFNGFNEIIAYKNTVTLLPESPGFKGLIGWDTPGAGGDITYSPVIRASLNVLPNTLRSDYSPLPNSTNDNPIVCFKNTKFTTSLQVLINPLLVGESVSSGDVSGPSSSVDNAVVFFDGTTGKILKEHTNFKFITGATYGDQLKVPDIETDDHLSINEKLTTLDTRTQYQTANANITTLTGELDVAVIKSYQHNCELQFDDTDAALTADGTVTLSAPAVILSGTVNVAGTVLTNQTTFTQDQNLISKKYVDDANSAQDIKTQNITATPGVTTFTGTIGSDNVKAGNEVAIGTNAGVTSQGQYSVAIGSDAGNNNQDMFSVAIGTNAGQTTQSEKCVAIGYLAGNDTQTDFSVAVGNQAGEISQGLRGVSIGTLAGNNTQGTDGVAIGNNAGNLQQGLESVAIGKEAGLTTQGANGVAIGSQSGKTSQGANGISIGNQAGLTTQGSGSIALGYQSGNTGQGADAVAIGYQSGNSAQGQNTIAIGPNSGQLSQSTNGIAFGNQAGFNAQGISSIAIGNRAGRNTQGDYSVAIGFYAGVNNQAGGSIILNAEGEVLDAPSSGLYVAPIAEAKTAFPLYYNPTTREITHKGINSTFVLEEDAKFNQLETFASGSKYQSAVLGDNDNKIYGIPYDANHILEFDYTTNTVTNTYAVPTSGPGKYSGAVLHPNGKIYCCPESATHVLEFDPVTKAVNTFGSSVGSEKFFGAVLHSDGKIYCPPWNNTGNILVIDPVAGTTSTSVFPSITYTGSIGYGGGALTREGKIIFVPYDSRSQILEVDPVAGTATQFGTLTASVGYSGCVLADNGLIYAVPYGALYVLEIDPYNKVTRDIGFSLNTPAGSYKFRGGVLHPNGNIYCANFYSDEILEINPTMGKTREIKTGETPTALNFRTAGITLAPNGKMYCLPRANLYVLEVTPPGGIVIPSGRYLSPYYNKL